MAKKVLSGRAELEKLLKEARAEVTRLNRVRPPLPGEKPNSTQQKRMDEGLKLLSYSDWLGLWKTATDQLAKYLGHWRQWEKDTGRENLSPDQMLEEIRPMLIEKGWFPPEDLKNPGSKIRLKLEHEGWRPPLGEACRKNPDGTYSNSNHKGNKRQVLADILGPDK